MTANIIPYLIFVLLMVSGAFVLYIGLNGTADSADKSSPEGSNDLLKTHGIPRPEYLMVNMLALKLAALPGDTDLDKFDVDDINIPLANGTEVIIWSGSGWVTLAVRKENDRKKLVLLIDEQLLLLNAVDDLRNRVDRLTRERQAQQSSDTSLEALTAMLTPKD
jgi:hypothetical protein